MNTRIRYLVVDSKNTPIRPCDHGLHLPNVQNAKSPSILDEQTAILFAGKLAQSMKGQRFYVTKVLGGAEAFDELSAEAKPGVKLQWVAATADGTDAE